MYTGQFLGSPLLAVVDCSSAVRLCSAANMLLIDHFLPELESIVLASIITSEDAAIARGAAQALSSRIAMLLEELADAPSPTSADIKKMILNAATIHAMDATCHILSAHRGRLDRAVIASAAKQVVSDWRCDNGLGWRITWSMHLASLHLDCAEATSTFALIGSTFCDCGVGEVSQNSSCFLAHLMRCANSQALARALPLGMRRYIGKCSRCGIDRGSILCLGSSEAGTLAEVIAAAPQERKQVAATLAGFCSGQLVEIISDATARTLGDDFEQVVSRFMSEPYWAARWFTRERLLRLPLVQRRAVSTALLRDAARDLKEDVARTAALTLG